MALLIAMMVLYVRVLRQENVSLIKSGIFILFVLAGGVCLFRFAFPDEPGSIVYAKAAYACAILCFLALLTLPKSFNNRKKPSLLMKLLRKQRGRFFRGGS